MVKNWKIKAILDEMKELEDDIAVLQNNIIKAKEYLLNTKPEDIDIEYFNDAHDIERGLNHIELF